MRAEELPDLIRTIGEKEKQTVILLACSHESLPTIELQRRVIEDAAPTHLFVPMPHDMLNGHGGDFRKYYDDIRPTLPDHDPEIARLDDWRKVPNVYFAEIDYHHPIIRREKLARKAFARTDQETEQEHVQINKVSPRDQRLDEALGTLWQQAVADRNVASNNHMATTIADTLLPLQRAGKPFTAVVIMSLSQLMGGKKPQLARYDLKSLLKEKGLQNVRTMTLEPVASEHDWHSDAFQERMESPGSEHYLHRKACGIDVVVPVIDDACAPSAGRRRD